MDARDTQGHKTTWNCRYTNTLTPIFFFGPDQGEVAYPVHHMVLKKTSQNLGSELSAPMIPQMTVVTDLTLNEDFFFGSDPEKLAKSDGWVPTPAPTAPGTHGSRKPGCPPQRKGGRGRDSA